MSVAECSVGEFRPGGVSHAVSFTTLTAHVHHIAGSSAASETLELMWGSQELFKFALLDLMHFLTILRKNMHFMGSDLLVACTFFFLFKTSHMQFFILSMLLVHCTEVDHSVFIIYVFSFGVCVWKILNGSHLK